MARERAVRAKAQGPAGAAPSAGQRDWSTRVQDQQIGGETRDH